jgi:hypothetical protein
MQNTNDFLNSKNTTRLKRQASSSKHGGQRIRPKIIDKIHDQWCKDNGYKLQAPSSEKNNPQATSPKHKASSSKPEATSSRTTDPE